MRVVLATCNRHALVIVSMHHGPTGHEGILRAPLCPAICESLQPLDSGLDFVKPCRLSWGCDWSHVFENGRLVCTVRSEI